MMSSCRNIGGLAHPFYTHAILKLPHPCVFCKGGSEETLKGNPTLFFQGSLRRDG